MKKIKTHNQLKEKFSIVGQDIVYSSIHYDFLNDLVNELKEKENVFNQSKTFWSLTLRSLNESVLLRLCRIYDQQSSSISLINLLKTIEERLDDFKPENFLERLKDNPFAEKLARENRIPCKKVICEHKSKIGINNKSVKNLVKWRNNYIGHKGNSLIFNKNLLKESPLLDADIKYLINISNEIFSYYYYKFAASHWSRDIIGKDDYKNLINYANYGLETYIKNDYKF